MVTALFYVSYGLGILFESIPELPLRYIIVLIPFLVGSVGYNKLEKAGKL